MTTEGIQHLTTTLPPTAPSPGRDDLVENAAVVLGALEQVTGERDRLEIERAILRTLAEITGASEIALLMRDDYAGSEFDPAWYVDATKYPQYIGPTGTIPMSEQVVTLARETILASAQKGEFHALADGLAAYGLVGKRGLRGIMIMVYNSTAIAQTCWVPSFLSIFQNHINLLDDAERDTLTGLYNRRTFESALNRILAAQREARLGGSAPGQDRRQQMGDQRHWLAVADIDHFKRINDTFGHLYGDEVLLLVSRFMRQSFRREDSLFRFGGEEFVIALAPCTAENAAMVCERFRRQLFEHEFPQIGHISISIGYTEIDVTDAPATVVGRADEALYYSKQNGRNQINRHEDLVARGALRQHKMEGEVTLF